VRVEFIQSRAEDRLTGGIERAVVYPVLPGVGAYYGFTDELGILGGVYRGFSPPPPGSEDDIEPEYSVNYELGSRFKSGPARAELIGFFNDYTNLTNICGFAGGCTSSDVDRQFDAGDARIYGVEAFLDYEIEVGESKIPLGAAYTITRAQFLTTFTSDDPIYGAVEAGDRIPYVPEHQLNASLGFEHHRAGVVLGVGYVSRMREQASSESIETVMATDEQFNLDIGGKLRLFEPLTVYANVRNVLDSADVVSRRPFGARPNAPRWIQFGAKIEL
jgi:Fe(3+) dicitrate transport protein